MEPPAGTIERWAYDYITTRELAHKLGPPAAPEHFETAAPARRVTAPGRPPELEIVSKSRHSRGRFRGPKARARLLHTFMHHELQAAELMCWALLAFPATPEAFRRGLVRITLDEVRHMGLYREHIESLGFAVGEFPVRDWFWERVPRCDGPASFVAVLGMGFEGANLDHSQTWAARFREAGDEAGAVAQERVGREEVAHVRFAARWFTEWTGGQDFDVWAAALPAPLSPMLMRGDPVRRDLRVEAGQTEQFVDRLIAWTPPDAR